MYFYIVVCNGISSVLYFWPGHDIAAHYHTTFDAMALSKEKSIYSSCPLLTFWMGGGGRGKLLMDFKITIKWSIYEIWEMAEAKSFE